MPRVGGVRAWCAIIALALLAVQSVVLAATFSLSPSSLTFGSQEVGTDSLPQTVILTNKARASLTFAVETPEGFHAADGCGGTVAAGATCPIAVTFRPTFAGTRTVKMIVTDVSKSSNKLTLGLTGTGVPSGPGSIAVAPESLTFGPTLQGATSSAAVTLTNNQAVSLTSVQLATASPFTATGCTGTIAPGASCTFNVVFAPTTQAGEVSGLLTVSSPQAANSPTVALAGTAVRRVLVSPDPLPFPDTSVASSSAPLLVTVTNNQTSQLTLNNPLVTFGGLAAGDYVQAGTTCKSKLAVAESCTVGVVFRPSQGGLRPATLGINSKAFGSPHTIALTGTGTAPLTVSPASLDFGNTSVGLASAPQSITVRNNQFIAANLSSIAVNGDFGPQAVGTTCGSTLAAGASCTVAIVATPARGGQRTGSVVITSDTSESPNLVLLSGYGINAVTASVASLTFAPQAVGTTSSAQQIVLTNHQDVASALNTQISGDFAASDGCGGTVAGRTSCVVSVTFAPTAVGARAGTVSFTSPAGPDVSVALSGTGAEADPPAAVAAVSPGAGTIGTTVPGVMVTGNGFTHFSAGSLVSFGEGIAVSNLRNVSAGSLTVDLAIAADAVAGARTVTVATPYNGDTETAVLAAGFVVSATAERTLVSVASNAGAQGQTLDVAIVGSGTHFQQGVTIASFGDGITINALSVQDQTHATANITISPTAVLGWRTVTLVTGGEFATLAPTGSSGPGFNVVAGPAALVAVSPSSGAQGAAPFAVTVTGSNTHFQQGVTIVSFGAGIAVGEVQVASATQLTVSIAISAGTGTGPRTVTATTGGEVAVLIDGFVVTAAPLPVIGTVDPTSGRQGESFTMTITGVNTTFNTDVPAPSLSLGSNITVSDFVVVNDTTITATVSISALAFTGPRQGILSSGGTNHVFAFDVLPSNAAIQALEPASGPQGRTVSIALTGSGTHWQQGTTQASFDIRPGCVIPVVTLVNVNRPTSAVVDVAIPENACVGPTVLRISTGGEVLTAVFNVYAQTPSLSLSPSTAMVGTALTVNVLGEFSHFGGDTAVVIDGTGVAIQNFVASSTASGSATFVVSPDAPVGPRSVTLTTPLGDGAFETLTATFLVTSTPAVLTSIEPFHASPGTALSGVRITGLFTHFDQEQTSVGFGPDVTVSGLTVLSETELTVDLTIVDAAAIGWRSAFVNTGSEQLTIGFRIDGPAAPAIASISPSSAAQGESLAVTITGANTNFNASSQLILGAGVTVASFEVTSPTTATAVVAVSPTAPIGPNTVIVLTDTGGGREIATGAGFSVTGGVARILSVTPAVGSQGQVLNIAIVGQATNWLQGATFADFGPGIVVTQLSIADATHATAQIAVLSAAALGFRTVTLITDGEYASLSQGFAVQQGAPVLLSSSPNAGEQGTTFDVQVLGQFTHWEQGSTSASYGRGVVVNSFTVVDSVSGVVNVTIEPTAFTNVLPNCRALTVTTGTEQVSLANQLCVTAGNAAVATVSPNAAPQGSTLTVEVTGFNTHFIPGVTTANFGAGVSTSNVTVTSATTASVDLAISTEAPSGFRTATMTTLGEVASLDLAFDVGPNTPTLNGASPFTGQRGQTLVVRLTGQYTHWMPGVTTVTFGQGVTVAGVDVVNATTADASIVIDPLANLGARMVTVTTGGEIVSAAVFSVLAGGASITEVAPQNGNQGQEVVLAITGQNTNWQQGFTQFSIPGAGGDIRINYVVINSATSATAGITIAPGATLGARSIYMITGAEALVLANAFVVTGGVPAIGSIAPGSARAGDAGLNVQIAGLHTTWLTGTTTIDFGPGIAVMSSTVNSDASITAVLDVHPAAGLGARTVIVRNMTQTGTQALTGHFAVVSPQPPAPFVSYLSPTSGLRGQTFTVSISAQHTQWDPNPLKTRIDFGDPAASGISINSFQVTSPTSARVNITIAPDAAIGTRTISIATDTETGTEVVQTSFAVVQATPVLTIVDPASGMQGATMTVNVLAQHTAFDETTSFDFGTGVDVQSIEVLGPTVAQATIAIDLLAPQGFRYVTATTGGVPVSGAGFVVTASQATILSVTPNTARQQEALAVDVVGASTNWGPATVFTLTGGITVVDATVHDATHATLSLQLAPLATLGAQSITATTGGEIAVLTNAFVVQPGTPLILSSTPGTGQQQANLTLAVLGQSTNWIDGVTTVALGTGVTVNSVVVTSPTALTVTAIVDPLTALGYRSLTVTTGEQALVLPNALLIVPGPAVVGQVSPSSASQGDTLDVQVTGTNTHFIHGTTTADFGSGITVNALQVLSPTSAQANISIDGAAAVGQRNVTLTTLGETAAKADGFIVQQGTPFLQFVTPSNGAQGATLTVSVIGSLTNFNGSTSFDFGPGISVTSSTILGPTQADVTIAISPVAARTTRNVSATTGSVVAIGESLFTVTSGPAAITAIEPADVYQGQSGIVLTISGSATHFTAATPLVSLGPGVTVTQVVVDSATQLRATVDVSPTAPVQFNDVVVTTLGEVATLAGVFQVRAAPAVIVGATPFSGYQEQTLDVAVTGAFTHFSTGATTASFGPGITVNTVTVQTHTAASVNITIGSAAAPGERTITLTTAGEVATGDGLFTVLEKITPVIAWPMPANITYGTALGGAQLNAATGLAGSFIYTPAAGTVLPAGAHELSVVFTPDDTVKYRSASGSVSLTVDPAGLQVKADDKVRTFGTPNPPLTYSITGFVQGETPAVLTGAPELSTVATIGSSPGSYPIAVAQGTLSAANYSFTFVPGTLAILGSAASTLVQHVGLTDPISEGFVDRGGMASFGPVSNDNGFDAWQIVAGQPCCSYFYHPLTDAQAAQAFAEGWRLTGRMRIVGGQRHAALVLDTGAARPRFDVRLETVGADAVISLPDSALSYTIAGGANQWVLLELVYDPVTATSALYIDGVKRLSGYAGWTFARENKGVFFGTAEPTVNFNLVRFDVGTLVVDFEDQPDSIPFSTPFPSSYRGITWKDWLHYAPYVAPYLPDGVNGVYAAIDGASFTFSERVFAGAEFSRHPSAPGDIYFELYRQGTLVWTSGVLQDLPSARTFLPSGYAGLVDEVRVRSLGASMTGGGAAWVMDNVTFGSRGAQAVPVLTWSTPDPIVFGAPLSGTQLNATANVPGSFVYTPPAGTVLPAGTHGLSVTFTPEDTVNYEQAAANVSLTVLMAPQATLTVTGAPGSADNGTSFTVGSAGGSGTGAVTFSATGACTNTEGGAVITMTASSGTCSIVATKQSDGNYLAAVSDPVVVNATAPLATLGTHVVGGFDSGRAGGYGLTSGGALTSFRSDFASMLPNARLAASDTITEAFLAGIDVALLASPTSNGSAVSPLTAGEQTALRNFVLNGGGAVILVDNDSFTPVAPEVNNSFLAPFGMHVSGTDNNFSSGATVENPGASLVTSGPFGTVPTLTLVVPGWIDELGPATSLGTLNVNGQPFLAVIPSGALGAGSGPVVVMSDTDLDSSFWNTAYRSLVFNAIAFVSPDVLADFETGDLEGWTLTGNAWTVGGTTNTSPNIEPISGSKFARSGAPNANPPSALAESNTGTATSPAYTVTARTLSWYSTGWSGPSGDGLSYFQVLDESLAVRAQVAAPQSDAWLRLSIDLIAAGLAPGDTFYFRAVDGHGENNYAWLAFDRLALRGSVSKVPQATLSVVNAPASAPNGTTFTVSTSGGSGTGAVTFSVTGPCTNTAGGPQITMTAATGTCSIVATKAADATYEEAISAPALVQAIEAAAATVDVVETTTFLSVCVAGDPNCPQGSNAAVPGTISVRLQSNAISVAAPVGGVAFAAVAADPQCVAVGNGLLVAGASSVSLPVTYGGTATLPCGTTVTVSADGYGSDTVDVHVVRYADPGSEQIRGITSGVSYYNPAPVPDPVGAIRAGVTAVSYYNPAQLPEPGGVVRASVAALSYYNPALIPELGGAVRAGVAAVSYYNPAQVPEPGGVVRASIAALSYYNPALVPEQGGLVRSGVSALSYCNPAAPCDLLPQSQQATEQPAVAGLSDPSVAAAAGGSPDTVSSAVVAISIANGPTAGSVRPIRLSRSTGSYLLRIDGANLAGATSVAFVGLEHDVSIARPVVSDDGHSLIVEVFVLSTAPLGPADVVVRGPGWSTPQVPTVRVEIVP